MKEYIECRDWNEARHRVRTCEMNFRVSCYGIIIQDGSLLLSPQRDGYDFPGGGMNIDETIEECLVREVWEETGMTVKSGQFVHIEQEFYFALNTQTPYNNTLLYFLCHEPKGELSTDGFDTHEKEYARLAEWISLDHIESIRFHNPVDSVSVIHKAMHILK